MRKFTTAIVPVLLSIVIVIAAVGYTSAQPAAARGIDPPTATPRPRGVISAVPQPREAPATVVKTTLRCTREPVEAGDIVTYQLSVRNRSDEYLSGLRLEMSFPDSLRPMKARLRGGTVETSSKQGEVVGRIKHLNSGDTVTLTVSALVTRAARGRNPTTYASLHWAGGSLLSNACTLDVAR
jgi:hypothetical protein